MTETGMSLGTPHYMSPEQATGDRTLDARSDIYALGCVTYEMLSGEPPYLGNTAQAIVAKILTELPTPVRKRRGSVPVHIDAAVQMALAKLPADRFATAAEFSAALVNPGFTLPGALEPTGSGDTRWKGRAQVAFGLAAVLAATTLFGFFRPRKTPPAPVTRVGFAFPQGEGLRQGPYGRFAISPDGARLAYVSTPGTGGALLVVRERDQLHATALAGSETAYSPFFSPDGKSVAFFSGAAAPTPLKVVSLTGAPAITVADTGLVPMGGDWGPDGYLYVSGNAGLVRIPASGGAMEPLTRVDQGKGASNHAWPQVLPGAKAVVFTVLRAVAAQREIAVLDLASKSVTTVMRGTFARYAPTGHLVYVRDDGALMAAPFDIAGLKVTGQSVALFEGIAIRTFGVPDVAFSQSGTLIYGSGSAGGLEHVSWVTRDGKATDVEPSWTADFITHALSPNGKRLAVSILKEGSRDLWIKDLDEGPLTRFTFDGSINHRPEWTRDGRSVTFFSDRSGRQALYGQRADGSGTAELLIGPEQEPRGIAEGFWSPDGKWLIYRTLTGDGGAGDIMGFRPGVDSAPVPLVATRFAELQPTLSSDGRWLAYASTEAGQIEVYVRPFPNVGDGRWQVSAGGGREPVWAHSGRELFYKSPDDQVMVATVTAGTSFEVRDRKGLFSAADYDNDIEHARFNVSPDDQRLLMSRKATSTLTDLVLVLNWFEELKARVR